MADSLKPGRTDTFEESRGVAMALGDIVIETPHGRVLCTDAPGLTTLFIEHSDPGASRIAIVAYTPPETEGGTGTAMIAQLDDEVARTIAASLLRLADRIKPLNRQ